MKKKPVVLLVSAFLSSTLLAPSVARSGEGCSHEAEDCVRELKAKLENRGWIGIEFDKEGREHPVITRVVPDSPAQAAGLAVGDALVAFNGVATSLGEKAVAAELDDALKPGRKLLVTVERGGDQLDLTVTLAQIPEALLAQWIGQHMLKGHSGQVAEASPAPQP